MPMQSDGALARMIRAVHARPPWLRIRVSPGWARFLIAAGARPVTIQGATKMEKSFSDEIAEAERTLQKSGRTNNWKIGPILRAALAWGWLAIPVVAVLILVAGLILVGTRASHGNSSLEVGQTKALLLCLVCAAVVFWRSVLKITVILTVVLLVTLLVSGVTVALHP